MMHPKKKHNILNLPADERAEYTFRMVAGFEIAAMVGDSSGHLVSVSFDGSKPVFLIWPELELAEDCMLPQHKDLGYSPMEIGLVDLLDGIADEVRRCGGYFGVFFDEKRSGIELSADDFVNELNSHVGEHY